MSEIEIRVPDIGDFKNVPVIEILVAPGDAIEIDDNLLTLESDKATMDVPSSVSGTIKAIAIKVGDRISQGDLIAVVETSASTAPESGPNHSTAVIDEPKATGDAATDDIVCDISFPSR